MSFLRKLELSSGVITAVLGLLILLTFIREDQEAAQRLQREFPLSQTILVGSLVYILPSFLVLIGSYVHAVKQKPSGQIVLMTASLAIVIIFLLSLVPLVWAAASLWPLLSVLLTLFAILTSVISLLVRRER
jgi:cytochrome bd-type quinol oxidase subunit 2